LCPLSATTLERLVGRDDTRVFPAGAALDLADLAPHAEA
jgi:hypothetical protein